MHNPFLCIICAHIFIHLHPKVHHSPPTQGTLNVPRFSVRTLLDLLRAPYNLGTPFSLFHIYSTIPGTEDWRCRFAAHPVLRACLHVACSFLKLTIIDDPCSYTLGTPFSSSLENPFSPPMVPRFHHPWYSVLTTHGTPFYLNESNTPFTLGTPLSHDTPSPRYFVLLCAPLSPLLTVAHQAVVAYSGPSDVIMSHSWNNSFGM